VFVINIAQAGNELNFLGWPFSAPAALAYYIPIALVIYYLLFTLKKQATFLRNRCHLGIDAVYGGAELFCSYEQHCRRHFPSYPEANLAIAAIWCMLASVLGVLNLILLTTSRQKRSFSYFSLE
jgi:hypothetical protein